MITLFDDWVILVNQYDYCLARKRGTTTRKNGKTEDVFQRIAYYSSVDGCLERLGREISKEQLKDGSHSLSEAVKAIRESNAKVSKLVKKVLAEMESDKYDDDLPTGMENEQHDSK